MAKTADIVASARATVGHIIRFLSGNGAANVMPNRQYLDFGGNCTVIDDGTGIRVTVPAVPAGSVTVGNVITLPAGEMASVTNTGTPIHALLNFSLPAGHDATIAVGGVEQLDESAMPWVQNVGSPTKAILSFGIPKGRTATISIGTVTTLTSSEAASVENSGDSTEAVFDFGIPQGKAATVAIGTVTTLDAGSEATVTNVGTAEDAIFDFGIPRGDASKDVISVAFGGTGANTKAEARTNLDVPSISEMTEAVSTAKEAAETAAQSYTDGQIATLSATVEANNAAAMHLAGAETVTGDKIFSGAVRVPTVAADNNSTQAASTAWVRAYFEAKLAEIYYWAKNAG